MSENTQQEIQSPCIGVCSMDDTTGYCHGCYRTIDEIKAWWDMSQDDQQNLLTALDERQVQTVNFD
ncbi:MAG: DUF1289 domain-containing protein [Methylotenera sp.]|jgi:predicted Fe-S protein YdhL (DUF1289 family)|nr:DUF1289 domain-containing protein [Methylotenera sp.]OGV78076.1 MAG: DUF1289 domain-containing protein [Methylotenera sp. RIFCSPLOWO2_02_FULL_45_14]